ncbi:hypothetical protein EON63_21410 [archaeon]|nr:MAG: hypothetical protein EON63_21410 [archaeon]
MYGHKSKEEHFKLQEHTNYFDNNLPQIITATVASYTNTPYTLHYAPCTIHKNIMLLSHHPVPHIRRASMHSR